MKISDLPFIDAMSGPWVTDWDAADDLIKDIRAEYGMARSQRGLEILSYELGREVLRDDRFVLGNKSRMKRIGTAGPDTTTMFTGGITAAPPVEHARMRRAVAPFFSGRGAEKLRELVTSSVESWVDENMQDGGFDFSVAVGRRLPATVFCALIGSPLDDWDNMARISEDMLLSNRNAVSPEGAKLIEECAGEIEARISDAIARRRKEPGDDLVSYMLAVEARGEMNESDMRSVLRTAFLGSVESTDTQICMDLESLAKFPDQWALLKNDHDLVPQALVELHRYKPSALTPSRSVEEAFEWHDIELGVDDTVLVPLYATHQDPTVFPNPRTLDITRDYSQAPYTFGLGQHGCLGRHIATLELDVVLRVVLDRWKSFDIVDSDFLGIGAIGAAVRKLEVRFEAEKQLVGA